MNYKNISENYKYVLNYTDDDNKVSFEFSANIFIDDLVRNLKRFLLACGWREHNLNDIFKKEEDV